MLRGAIFDLDGTLLDSMRVWNTLASAYLHSIGYTPRADVDAVVSTFSLQQAARYFQTEYGVALSEEAIMDGVKAMIHYFTRWKFSPSPAYQTFFSSLPDKV